MQKNLFAPEACEPAPWEIAAEADRWVAELVFNRPVDTVFRYLVPDELRALVGPGQRVRAPFGRGDRPSVGYCVAAEPLGESSRRLKSIDSVIDREPLLPPNMLALTRWIAERYLCGWGQVLEAVIPAGVKKSAGTRVVSLYEAAPDVCARLGNLKLSPKQRSVLDALCAAGGPMRVDDLAEAAACGTAPMSALRKKGLIVAIRQRAGTFVAQDAAVDLVPDLALNPDQRRALDEIQEALRAAEHRTILLHGVTGSGKTEVYIQAIREVAAYGRQAIVMVPEISLTPQTIRRFRSRFESVAVLHSHLSDSERHWQWQQIARGGVQVVVGARSAVFAPAPHLGLIVIDEEHETSFKQETTPRYHAREVARERARLEGIPLILGSATPTLESWQRVQAGPDRLISLPCRVEGRPLPPVAIIDVRHDPHVARGFGLGRALEQAVRTALADGGQVILFLNLRGFSPVLWCRACGEGIKCPACDVTLTWHKDRNVALCHSCDHQTLPPSHCPQCGHAGVRYLGIGTQRLEHEVRARFPGAACQRMDSDAMRRPGSHDAALEAFRRGDVRILLGTQMIAKGLDFPDVTLVGVINADTVLHQPDLRAAERTFQLISQVAGRTGRGARGGRVLVQSSCPEEPAIVKAAAHDYVGFVTEELAHRREMGAPPFCHLARVILRGPRVDAVEEQARRTADMLRGTVEAEGLPVRILGPAPAPVARLKNHYRFHLQLAAEDRSAIQRLWRATASGRPAGGGVECAVDVDPISMR